MLGLAWEGRRANKCATLLLVEQVQQQLHSFLPAQEPAPRLVEPPRELLDRLLQDMRRPCEHSGGMHPLLRHAMMGLVLLDTLAAHHDGPEDTSTKEQRHGVPDKGGFYVGVVQQEPSARAFPVILEVPQISLPTSFAHALVFLSAHELEPISLQLFVEGSGRLQGSGLQGDARAGPRAFDLGPESTWEGERAHIQAVYQGGAAVQSLDMVWSPGAQPTLSFGHLGPGLGLRRVSRAVAVRARRQLEAQASLGLGLGAVAALFMSCLSVFCRGWSWSFGELWLRTTSGVGLASGAGRAVGALATRIFLPPSQTPFSLQSRYAHPVGPCFWPSDVACKDAIFFHLSCPHFFFMIGLGCFL